MATLSQWIGGARPRTLPAAVAPVVLGTAAAAEAGRWVPGLALLALLVAVALQVGVNYANDYSDGVRGTDEARVGPVRLVGQRLADPENVKLMALAWLGLGALAGLALVTLSGAWLLLLLGGAAVLAAWGYTGGSRPYGYRGLGEIAVFAFFGLLATLGTQHTQAGRLTGLGWLAAVGVGALATAILVANNLRDVPSDTAAGKRTLAVRLGDRRTRVLYLALLAAPVLCTVAIAATGHPFALLSLLGLLLATPGARAVATGATGRQLVPALASTGLAQLGWALVLTAALVAR